MKVEPPWWFCNGWWSPWCVIDTIAHEWFRLPLASHGATGRADAWICRKHDVAVERNRSRREV